jgi:hypothetical protein
MRIFKTLLIGASCAALLTCALPATARADAFNKETLVTFNAPVEMPGVVLPAGTYRFQLADPDGDRAVVRVMNPDGKVVYGTFLTIPEAQVNGVNEPQVTFNERVAGSPQAIRTWAYPGDDVRWEFLYHR